MRTRFFHYEMVDAISPDVITAAMAERYLSNVIADRKRPHALAYPLMRGRATAPTENFSSVWNDTVDSSKLSLGMFEKNGLMPVKRAPLTPGSPTGLSVWQDFPAPGTAPWP